MAAMLRKQNSLYFDTSFLESSIPGCNTHLLHSVSHRVPSGLFQYIEQPLQVLSYGPVDGPPGTMLEIRAEVLDNTINHYRLLVAFGQFSDWAVSSLCYRGDQLEVNIKVACPDLLQDAQQYPLTLHLCNEEVGQFQSIPFGIFWCVFDKYIEWYPETAAKNGQIAFEESVMSEAAIPPQTWNSIEADLPQYSPWKFVENRTHHSVLQCDSTFDTSQAAMTVDEAVVPLRSASPVEHSTPEQDCLNASSPKEGRRTKRLHHRSRRTTVHVPLAPRTSAHGTPSLVRTSQMAGVNTDDAQAAQRFNAYTIYPNKAVLKIDGDLESMACDWDNSEQLGGRRLVEFKRRQSGRTIHVSFKPTDLAHRGLSTFCVSCIYWKDKGEAYVTSVDTIHLLQCIIGIRFTVEEKNRIRRNLEGFHPLTVSKAKPDSGDFFNLVMGFPHPKPRNIEKDVKVFPWKKLGLALKKIIGKYSASPSSTAGLLETDLTMTTREGHEHHPNRTPALAEQKSTVAPPADQHKASGQESRLGPESSPPRSSHAASSFQYTPSTLCLSTLNMGAALQDVD